MDLSKIRESLGEVHKKARVKEYEATLQQLDEILAKHGNDAEALQLRGIAKYLLRNFPAALEDFNRANSLVPNDPTTLSWRGNTKRMLGDEDSALEDLNRANEIKPNDAFILSRRGATKRFLFDLQGVLEDLDKANEIRPNDAFILRYRGETKRNLRDYQGALEDLNKSDELEKDDAFTLRERGITKRMLGDYEGSIEDLNRADQIKPNNSFTLYQRGVTHRLRKDYFRSLEDLNRADLIEPNDALTLQERGVTKRLLQDYEGSIEDLTRANDLDPDDPLTLSDLGEAKRKLKRYKEALKDFNAAELIKHYAHTIKRRGITKYHLQDYEGALQDIKLFLKERPDDDEIGKLREMEQQLKLLHGVSNTLNIVQEGVLEIPFNELKITDPLGEGGFGIVSLAEWQGIKLAIKRLKSTVTVNQMSHEAKTLVLMRYKFIVAMMGVSKDPSNHDLILVMEYMRRGSLEGLLFNQKVKLSLPDVIQIGLDIAKGIHFLHSQDPKVIHRDLKSANVLLHRGMKRAKIADFGTAKFLLPNVPAKTVIGAVGIAIPPEMLAEKEYDEKVDIFSFGVVMYEMLTNARMPILEESDRLERIGKNIINELLAELVTKCCASDPKKRPNSKELVSTLREMKMNL